jgi:peptidoglycan/xylan/chitin deacetylase (PgdA/CDA1 family)
MRGLIEQFLARGYTFSDLEDPADDTVSITFDDGYANNLLFTTLAEEYKIPFVVFVSAYYTQTGEGFPWMKSSGQSYDEMHRFDYYSHHSARGEGAVITLDTSPERPMTYEELATMNGSDLMEIGCHGYYHQPLSKEYEEYTDPERSRSMAVFDDHLGVRPRYYALANGMYTKRVVRELLQNFSKVFTIDGTAYRPKNKVVHRLSLTSPNTSPPLIDQVDKSMRLLRQVKRAFRTRRRLI